MREETHKSETVLAGSSTDKFSARHPVALGPVGFGTPRFGEVNATLIIKSVSLADTKVSGCSLSVREHLWPGSLSIKALLALTALLASDLMFPGYQIKGLLAKNY